MLVVCPNFVRKFHKFPYKLCGNRISPYFYKNTKSINILQEALTMQEALILQDDPTLQGATCLGWESRGAPHTTVVALVGVRTGRFIPPHPAEPA